MPRSDKLLLPKPNCASEGIAVYGGHWGQFIQIAIDWIGLQKKCAAVFGDFSHPGVFVRREDRESLSCLGQYFFFFKNDLIFVMMKLASTGLQGLGDQCVTCDRLRFIVVICEYRVDPEFGRQQGDFVPCGGMTHNQTAILFA